MRVWRDCAEKQFVDYTTSMITYSDPLLGYLYYEETGISHTPYVVEEATLEVTPGQILSQSATDATRLCWHVYGS